MNKLLNFEYYCYNINIQTPFEQLADKSASLKTIYCAIVT